MSFDPSSARYPRQVYLTMDAWRGLDLLASNTEHRDRIIETALWDLLSKEAGLVDCVNAIKEAERKFKEAQKSLNPFEGER